MELQIPPEVWNRWHLVAAAEAAVFFGIVFVAILLHPVWVSVVVFIVGLFASGAVWILTLRAWKRKHPTARRVPKL